LQLIDAEKRKNRVVERPYSVPRKRAAGPEAELARKKRADLESAARSEAAELRKLMGEEDEEGGGNMRLSSNAALLKARAEADAIEHHMSEVEDHGSSPRTNERRRILRLLDNADVRMKKGYVVCEWGCKQWVMRGELQRKHEQETCGQRLTACKLGCGLFCCEDDWLINRTRFKKDKFGRVVKPQEEEQVTSQRYHEEEECRRRLVPCTLKCGEWVHHEELEKHVVHECVKRPVPPMPCRLGCDKMFAGGAHRLLELEEERLQHEQV
jgi:hypothetical protein